MRTYTLSFKKYLLSFMPIVIMVLMLFKGFDANAQLSGTYTISPSLPPSAGNFQSLTAAVDSLKNKGVSGPVVFDISSGTYTEKLVIPNITGTSAANNITFRSEKQHADSVTLNYNVGTDTAVIILDSAVFINFKYLTIATIDPTKGRAFQFTTTANNDSITHCKITAGNAAIYAYLVTGGKNVFSYNNISGGTFGIYLYGVSNSILSDSIIISNNTIHSSLGNACDLRYTRNLKIRDNIITTAASDKNAIYSLFSHHAQEITGNTITPVLPGRYGIYVLYATGIQTAGAFIANNVIANMSTGIYCFNGNYARIYHNTINAMAMGIEALEWTNGEFKNNIAVVSNLDGYPFGIDNPASNIIDYNMYYQPAGRSPIDEYSNMMSWQSATAQDSHSVVMKPYFTSATDLHINEGCIYGTYLPEIPRDKDGVLRPALPLVGAYEYSGINNITADKVVQPSGVISSGLQNLTVRVRNTGTNPVTSFNVGYILNNGTPVIQSWTGTLAPCDSALVTFTAGNQVNLLSENTITVFTNQPNAVADTYPGNDSVKAILNTPLNGTYSIGGAGARFATFNEAVTALKDGVITGPVVFNVHTGTYTENLIIPPISGTSFTNTITFQSAAAHADSVILTWNVGGANPIISLNNASHIHFKYITIASIDSSSGTGVELTGSGSYNNIAYCKIRVGRTGIGASGFSGANNIFTYNDIIGGNDGIVIEGVSATITADSNIVSNNNILNVLDYGCYLYYTQNTKVRNNTITGNSGIYANYNYNALEISGNLVQATGNYGVYMYNTNATASLPALVINNSITGGSYGLRNYYGSYQKFYHNTIVGDLGVYISYNNISYTNNEWKNNIITSSNTGNAARINNSGQNNVWDYNIYYTNGANVFYNSATAFSTWQSSNGGQDLQSVFMDPGFVSATNLRLTAGCMLGVALPAVTLDIDSVVRNATPTIGAYEYTASNNIGVIGIELPGNGIVTPGVQDITVKVKNTGANVVYSFNVSYVLNNNTEVRGLWSGTLNPCDTASFVFTNFQQINIGGINKIKVYTDLPNGLPDVGLRNDTFRTIIYTPFSGNYSIGATGADFTTFAEALSVLSTAGGVAGPVVFNVSAGTYTERVVIPTIQGASPTNTITFDGGPGNAATRIISFNGAASATRATVQISSSPYISLRNLTIRTTGGTYGWGVHIFGAGANGCKIKNCVVDITGSGTTSTSVANYNGIVISNSATSATSGVRADSLEIDSNTINYGGYGIVHIATAAQVAQNNKFRNNIITNSYTNAIYISYHDNAQISGNIMRIRTGNTTARAVYLLNCNSTGNNHTRITENIISNTGQYGISLSGSSNTGALKGLIANNVIGNGFQHASALGIHMATSSKWNIFHNTINRDREGSTGVSNSCLTIASGDSISIYNNIFAISGSGVALPVYVTNTSSIDSMDYNLLHTINSPDNLFYIGGTTYNSNTLKGGAGLNLNSLATQPPFVNDTNLHITKGCNDGVSITGIATDVENVVRNNPPDIGAYEYSGINNIAIDKLVTPEYPFAAGQQDLVVRVSNGGANAVNSFNISYRLNNGSVVTQQWGGYLVPCDTVLVTFTGTQQLNLGNINNLTVYTDQPNGFSDTNPANDTLMLALNTPLNGTYTIGHSGADFASFAEAVGVLGSAGISGPVIFSVKTGTYTESIIINNVIGGSETNTVTFQSAALHADSVVLNYTVALVADPIIKLDNASYINIKYLTIASLDNTKGRGIELTGTSSSDSIIHCKISARDAGIYGRPVSGGKNVFSNNHISGTNTGVMFQGQSNVAQTDSNVISYNNIMAELAGVNALFTKNLKIRNNKITGGNNGIQSQQSYDRQEITGNEITSTANYGMLLQFGFGGYMKPGLITNNTVISNGVGIYSFFSGGQKFYHNNIRATGIGIEVAYEFASDTLNEWQNNIITSTDTLAAYIWSAGYTDIFDYNLYHNGGSTLFGIGGTSPVQFANLSAWQLATRRDSNSVFYRPPFTGPANLAPNLTDTASWIVNGNGIHLDSTMAIATDINGNPRPVSRAAGAPDIGAYELTPTIIPPLALAFPDSITPYQTTDTIQVFMFEGDTIARIKWHAYGYIPKVKVKRYPGIMPENVSTHQHFMYFYTSIDTVHTGTPGAFTYDVDIYYKNTWLGTNPLEADIRLSKRDQNSPWALPTSSLLTTDTVRNILSAYYLASFSQFSGTNFLNPMPVKLISFNGERSGKDVLLSWTTASEINNKGFEIQRSTDGRTFEKAGFVKGNGSTNIGQHYSFVDYVSITNQRLFYRLKQVDLNDDFVYSGIVVINPGTEHVLNSKPVVFPNPFSSELFISINESNETTAKLEVFDIRGMQVLSENFALDKGTNSIRLKGAENLQAGVYFVSVITNENRQVIKVIKQ